MFEIVNRELCSSEQHYRLYFVYSYCDKEYTIVLSYTKREVNFSDIGLKPLCIISVTYCELRNDYSELEVQDKIIQSFINVISQFPKEDIFGKYDEFNWEIGE